MQVAVSFTVLVLAGCTAAFPQQDPIGARTLAYQAPGFSRSESSDNYNQVQVRYVTHDGTDVNQITKLVPGSNGDYVPQVSYQTRHIAPDGQQVINNIMAGERYHSHTGSHVPTQK